MVWLEQFIQTFSGIFRDIQHYSAMFRVIHEHQGIFEAYSGIIEAY